MLTNYAAAPAIALARVAVVASTAWKLHIRFGYGANVASMAWGARHLISASPSGLLENEKMKEKPNYFFFQLPRRGRASARACRPEARLSGAYHPLPNHSRVIQVRKN